MTMKIPTLKYLFAAAGACILSATPHLAMAAEPEAKPVACADDANYQQHAFTVGKWDVLYGTIKAAEVRMEPVLKGCAINETWTQMGGRPGDGHGLFTYSRQLKSWHYLWAADNGNATSFNGVMTKPGEMLYVMSFPLPQGGKRIRHWTLTLQPDGHVRELSRGSDDDGKTWTTEYDLTWVKAAD